MGFDCIICFFFEKVNLPLQDHTSTTKYLVEVEHEQIVQKLTIPSDNYRMNFFKDPFNSATDEIFDLTLYKQERKKKLIIVAKGRVTLFFNQVIEEQLFYFDKTVFLNCAQNKKGKLQLKIALIDSLNGSSDSRYLSEFNRNLAKMKFLAILNDPHFVYQHATNLIGEIGNKYNIKQVDKKKLLEVKEEDFLADKTDDSFINDLSFCSISIDSDEDFEGKIISEVEYERKKLKNLESLLVDSNTKVDLDLENK